MKQQPDRDYGIWNKIMEKRISGKTASTGTTGTTGKLPPRGSMGLKLPSWALPGLVAFLAAFILFASAALLTRLLLTPIPVEAKATLTIRFEGGAGGTALIRQDETEESGMNVVLEPLNTTGPGQQPDSAGGPDPASAPGPASSPQQAVPAGSPPQFGPSGSPPPDAGVAAPGTGGEPQLVCEGSSAVYRDYQEGCVAVRSESGIQLECEDISLTNEPILGCVHSELSPGTIIELITPQQAQDRGRDPSLI